MSHGSRERSHAKHAARDVVRALRGRNPSIDRFTLIVRAGEVLDRLRPGDGESARLASYLVVWNASLEQPRRSPH